MSTRKYLSRYEKHLKMRKYVGTPPILKREITIIKPILLLLENKSQKGNIFYLQRSKAQ